ncbi:class I SAM-dependent methyltransferase [Bradyrhizobium sp. WSM 1704]|uniref:class I SAM-dependent methyltransferase n=1 Tax=Bradyrhizobium semiaridum TaxID=2821404 RepID=UPI001CE306B0|nr:class I SAM-dependent methyltransferase [Bradyrhizobium semiaridum]MCA6120553.1 class I SAM-dependent methyltransferase [Bradyrhizobium semiaridum]
MGPNSLYDRPDLYDLMAPRDPVLERFYVETARERGGRALDLACGSGRLSIPLAQAGLQVTGGDLSGAMLQHARRFAEAAAVELDLVQLDMRDFDLNGRTFDTIIVAVNSILHLHSLDDFERFFRSVARHLAVEGRLVFDVFLPSLALLGRVPGQRQLVGTAVHDTLGKVTVEEALARYDPLAQISHVDWYWSTDERKDFLKNSWQMRSIFPQEMPLLIAAGGMRLVERFGDFDRRPLTTESCRQICVCAGRSQDG